MDYSEYTPIPVIPGGRNKFGVDCWGLVVVVYAEKYDVKLPTFDGVDWTNSGDVWMKIADETTLEWNEISREDRRESDVVILRIKGIPWHVGFVIDKNRFMHADPVRGVCVERIDSLHWKNRVVAFYRHPSMS